MTREDSGANLYHAMKSPTRLSIPTEYDLKSHMVGTDGKDKLGGGYNTPSPFVGFGFGKQ